MTRKGKKAAGGHNPLTYHERNSKLLTGYGTQTERLTTESQRPFGHCCLGLQPAIQNPVATPSGHIYEKEAIVRYLVQKRSELKEEHAKYQEKLQRYQKKQEDQKNVLAIESMEQFQRKNELGGLLEQSSKVHSKSFERNQTQKLCVESQVQGQKTLKRTSYWLSENQPIYNEMEDERLILLQKGDNSGSAFAPPPPQRPSSPFSGQPLRLKDLIPLHLQTDNDDDDSKSTSTTKNDPHPNQQQIRFQCCVSQKTISTQPVICITKTGQVMLQSIYETLVKPTMICPITSQKFKEKHVLKLKKAASGFAASGNVQAKKYKPTLT